LVNNLRSIKLAGLRPRIGDVFLDRREALRKGCRIRALCGPEAASMSAARRRVVSWSRVRSLRGSPGRLGAARLQAVMISLSVPVTRASYSRRSRT
jgi:hypothetical protein